MNSNILIKYKINTTYKISLVLIVLLLNFSVAKHYYTDTLSLDEGTYSGIAAALLEGSTQAKVFTHTIDIGQEVTPFYPAIVAAAYFVDNIKWSIVILQIVLNLLTVLLLFQTILILFDDNLLSFITAGAFSVYFPLWAYNYYVMMEVPTVFLITWILYELAKLFKYRRIRHFYISTIIFGLLVLMNNRFIALIVVYIAYFIIANKQIRIVKIKDGLIALGLILFVLAPWFYRQYYVYNQFVFFTPLYHNAIAKSTGFLPKVDVKTLEGNYTSTEPRSYEEYNEELKSSSKYNKIPFTMEKYEYLIENQQNGNIYIERLVKYFRIYSDDYSFMYSNSFRLEIPTTLPHKIANIAVLLSVFLLGFFGSLKALIRKDKFIILLVLFFSAHVALHIAVHYIDRYRLTGLPIIIIIAAYGLNDIINYLKTMKHKNRKQIV